MDEYDEFSWSKAIRMILVIGIGLGVSIVVGIISIWVFNSTAAIEMIQFVTGLFTGGTGIDPILLIVLTFTFVSLVCPTAYLWGTWFFPSVIEPASFIPLVIASVITWIITGIVVGLLSKSWFQGLENAAITGVVVYLLDVILLLIVVAQAGLLLSGIITYGIIYAAFALGIIMAVPNLLILIFVGTLSGIVSRKLIFKEEYEYRT